LGRRGLDSGVDVEPVDDHGPDDPAGQLARPGIGLGLRELPLQDRGGGPLAEVRLEHGR
jgi:hypothetical protein